MEKQLENSADDMSNNIETMIMMMMMMMMMMMQMLISVTSCNVNAADNDQTTPLIMAALQGNSVICETLVRCLRPHVLLRSLFSFSFLPWNTIS